MSKVTFAAVGAPEPRIGVRANGEKRLLHFKDGVLHLDSEKDAAFIAELRDGIENRPNISKLIREVSAEKAAAVVEEHRKRTMAMMGGVRGQLDSATIAARSAPIREMQMQNEAAALGVSAEGTKELSDALQQAGQMEETEKVNPENTAVRTAPGDGFVPATDGIPPAVTEQKKDLGDAVNALAALAQPSK